MVTLDDLYMYSAMRGCARRSRQDAGKQKPSATLISEVRSVFFSPSLTAVKNKGGAVARYVVTAGFPGLIALSLPAFEIQSAVLEGNYL